METNKSCKDAIDMINEALKDENTAAKEYSQLIKNISNSKVESSLTSSMVSVVKKIHTDEKSHFKLLRNIKELLSKSCDLK